MKRFLACAFLALALPAQADVFVVDGDTLDLDGTRYRLNGIDAPEQAQSCKTATGKNWPCGKAASEALISLTAGKMVRCNTLGQDLYGREIATCTAGNTDLGREMVARGMAWAFLKFSDAYAEDQNRARSAQRGIWQGPAQPAWEFRDQKWSTASQTAPEGCPIKGNISDNGKIYHTPWSKWYSRTRINTAKGERWFCDEAEAQQAGWRAPR
jgi:endonuclease YncB( thermonuclease family)